MNASLWTAKDSTNPLSHFFCLINRLTLPTICTKIAIKIILSLIRLLVKGNNSMDDWREEIRKKLSDSVFIAIFTRNVRKKCGSFLRKWESFGHRTETADDIVQQAIENVYVHLEKLTDEEPITNLKAYLLTTAHRVAIGIDRKYFGRSKSQTSIEKQTQPNKSQKIMVSYNDLQEQSDSANHYIDPTLSAPKNPEQGVIADELQQMLTLEYEKLSKKQRQILDLLLLGHKSGEIAEILKISPGNARQQVYRVRKALNAIKDHIIGTT